MSKPRYLIQWFPTIIEEELSEVKMKKMLSEQEKDELKDELGFMMFGNNYNPNDNAELPSAMAGQLGSKVKEWKNVLEDEIVIKKQDTF